MFITDNIQDKIENVENAASVRCGEEGVEQSLVDCEASTTSVLIMAGVYPDFSGSRNHGNYIM